MSTKSLPPQDLPGSGVKPKAADPSSTPAPGSSKPKISSHMDKTLDLWNRLLVSYLAKGDLQSALRIAVVLGQLETPAKEQGPVTPVSASIDVHASKTKQKYIYVRNPFTATKMKDVFQAVGSRRPDLKLASILQALASGDFSKVIEPQFLPLDFKSPVIPFFLLAVYMKLTKATPDTTYAIFEILGRVREKKYENEFFDGSFKPDSFYAGLIERRVRFVEDANPSTMHFNEAFENSQLDYMNLQKKVDNLVKGEIYGDIKTHTEKVRDSLLQMDCFRRIHEYLSKSEKIVLMNLRFLNEQKQDLDESVFTRENCQLLTDLVRLSLAGQFSTFEIAEQSIRILTKYCLYNTTGCWKQPTIVDASRLVQQILSMCTTNPEHGEVIPQTQPMSPQRAIPLCVMFLGVAAGVLMEPDVSRICVAEISKLLRDRPAAVVRSRYLPIIMNGIEHLLVHVAVDDLIEVIRLFIRMWDVVRPGRAPRIRVPAPFQTSSSEASQQPGASGGADSGSKDEFGAGDSSPMQANSQRRAQQEADALLREETSSSSSTVPETRTATKDSEYPIPEIEDQVRVLRMFAQVYAQRRIHSEARLRSRRLARTSNRTPDNQRFMEKMRFASDGKDIEDEWLVAVSHELGSLFESGKVGCQYMALFAGTGIMKEMISEDRMEPAEALEPLNSMLTSAIMNVKLNRDLPFWTEWRRAITVVCVNIERSFPYIRDELLMELIVDVMLEDALNLNWLFNTPPKPENLQATLQHIEDHKQSGIFKMLAHGTKASAAIFVKTTDISLRSAILYRFGTYARTLFNRWKEYQPQLKSMSSPNKAESDTTVDKAIKVIFNAVFLSFTLFINLVHEVLTVDQVFMALDMFSWIDFCSVKGMTRHTEVLEDLVRQVGSPRSTFAQRITDFFPPLNDPKTISKSTIDKMDKMTLTRLKYVLSLWEVVCMCAPEVLVAQATIVSTKIVPMMFLLIGNTNKATNRKSHSVFAQLFSQNIPLREEIIPFYLKVSLDHFPELTAGESLAETCSAIATKLPPSSPLIPFTIKALSDKIKTIRLSKSAPVLIIIMFRLINVVQLQHLRYLLFMVEGIVKSSPKRLQEVLCKLLFNIISGNFDYMRKDTTIKWYLELCHSIKIQPPISATM